MKLNVGMLSVIKTVTCMWVRCPLNGMQHAIYYDHCIFKCFSVFTKLMTEIL